MQATQPSDNSCPCGSNQPLASCCLPVIQGKRKAATAEELLRARYTAFTRGDVDFVLSSHHSTTVHEVSRDEIAQWSKDSKWLGLQIAQIDKGTASDEDGTIIFCARYESEGKAEDHWEQSFFKREKGEWKFLDAKGVHIGTYRREEPKTGRNDPCPCGSGKKFKKCCAA